MAFGRGVFVCWVLTFALLVSLPVFAQVTGAPLSGTVSDPSGAAMPDAQLTIKNVATGVERTVTTNDHGFYTAVNLLAGSYQVTISAKGFDTEIKSGITMYVGGQQTFDVVLRVGTVANRVEVSAEVPAVQLSSSDMSAVGDG